MENAQILHKKRTEGFSGIQTRIVGVEGEHADHLSTTTDPTYVCFNLKRPFSLNMSEIFIISKSQNESLVQRW